jgi:3-hydroxymyristoyl/3-hydroxydecanoyl-(acyl carrier protein) dehydratase
MHVVPDARLFEGHFDDGPVLPGVALLDLAAAACRARGLAPGEFKGVRDVRFTQPVGRGDAVDIELAEAGTTGAVRFETRVRGQIAASGVLLFGSIA